MKLYRVVLAAIALAAALPVFAQAPQRIVRFAAGTVTGSESVVPTLSWCTETLPPGANPGPLFLAAGAINKNVTITVSAKPKPVTAIEVL